MTQTERPVAIVTGARRELVRCTRQGLFHALAQLGGLAEAPQPDMCVEQQSQRCIAAQVLGCTTGPTTSPEILIRPAMAPNHRDLEARRRGGTTSATGWPKRVIATGRPVCFTRCRTARQVALNLEIGMLSIGPRLTWSEIMLNAPRRVRLASNRLLKNTVRADPSTPSAARPTLRMNGVSGASHGVEAWKPLIGLRPVFRLRSP